MEVKLQCQSRPVQEPNLMLVAEMDATSAELPIGVQAINLPQELFGLTLEIE